MISKGFGWECDNINGTWEHFGVQLVTHAIIVRACLFSLSMSAKPSGGYFRSGDCAQILFHAGFGQTPTWSDAPNPDFGNAVLTPSSATAQMHGNGYGQQLVAHIMKMWVPSNIGAALTTPLFLSGLSIRVPENSWLAMRAGHAGPQSDFECQGLIFYEPAAAPPALA
jgi:hypothetical protein